MYRARRPRPYERVVFGRGGLLCIGRGDLAPTVGLVMHIQPENFTGCLRECLFGDVCFHTGIFKGFPHRLPCFFGYRGGALQLLVNFTFSVFFTCFELCFMKFIEPGDETAKLLEPF